MAFEAKILTGSKNKQAKLLRAAGVAAKSPDTGVKILKKSASLVAQTYQQIATKKVHFQKPKENWSKKIRASRGAFSLLGT